MMASMAAKKMSRPYVVPVGSGVVKLNILTNPLVLESTRGLLHDESGRACNAGARSTLARAHAILFVYEIANKVRTKIARPIRWSLLGGIRKYLQVHQKLRLMDPQKLCFRIGR